MNHLLLHWYALLACDISDATPSQSIPLTQYSVRSLWLLLLLLPPAPLLPPLLLSFAPSIAAPPTVGSSDPSPGAPPSRRLFLALP